MRVRNRSSKKATVLTAADGWGCSGWRLAPHIIYTQVIPKFKITEYHGEAQVLPRRSLQQTNCFTVSLQEGVGIWFTTTCHSLTPKRGFPIPTALRHENLRWSHCHFSRTDSGPVTQE